MNRKEERNSIIEMCPVRNVIARFGNKWAFLIILVLNDAKFFVSMNYVVKYQTYPPAYCLEH